jgi:hypothetical protein
MPIIGNEEARRKAGFLLFPEMGRVGLEPTTLCLKGMLCQAGQRFCSRAG